MPRRNDKKSTSSRKNRTNEKRARRNRTSKQTLDFHKLEDRRLLATFTVDSGLDTVDATDGMTTLREAVASANNTVGDDTIKFAAAVNSVNVAGGQLTITDSLTIEGSGASQLTINGNSSARLFNVTLDANDHFNIQDITLSGAGNNTGYGGAIYSAGESSIQILRSQLSGNIALVGGAIHSSGDVQIDASTISGNTASYGGGGISSFGGNVTLNNSTVSGNTAYYGGGISNSDGNTTLTNSTVSGNTASMSGGGIDSSYGAVSLTNSTVSGNTASMNGGGILSAAGAVTLTNSTVSGNTASLGGGINSEESLTVNNSIIAGNSDNGTAPDLLAAGPLTIQNSIIGNSTGTTLSNSNGIQNTDGNYVDVDFITVLETAVVAGTTVPKLADNGGPTQTIALVAGSLAIDSGDNALAVDQNNTALTTDQRGEGFDRLIDGDDDGATVVDIGASEFASSFLLGDVNQDDVVNFLDISPFIGVLSAGGSQAEADINQDGVVNFLDISPFIGILSSSSNIQLSVSDLLTGSADLSAPNSDQVSAELVATPASLSLPLVDAVPVQFSEPVSQPIRQISDGISVELVATPSIPTLLQNDTAVAQLSVQVLEPSLLAYIGSSQVQDGSDSFNRGNQILDWNVESVPAALPPSKTDSFPEQVKPSDFGSRSTSAIDASDQAGIMSSSAKLFDAHPEVLDELLDFQWDTITT